MFRRAQHFSTVNSYLSRAVPARVPSSAITSDIAVASTLQRPAINSTIGYGRFQARFHGSQSAADSIPPSKRSGLLHRYNMWSQRSPVISILVTSSTLWCLGDLSAQYIEGGAESPVASTTEERRALIDKANASPLQRLLPSFLRFLWSDDWFTMEVQTTASDASPQAGFCVNVRRLVATTVFGSLIAGVFGQAWYKYLDHLVLNVIKLENRGTRFVVTKWLIECAFWHPVTLFFFWVFVGVSGSGDNADQIKRQLKSDFLGTYAAEVALYTPVDLLNFSKVPLHLQVVVCNVASFFEAIMLSYLHNLSAQNEKKSTSTE